MDDKMLSKLRAIAKKRFDVKCFRPGQLETIEAVLDARDAVTIMPTGGGKSLCYQLPALVLEKPVLVVSPLLSLMQDQQQKLSEAKVSSEQLSSALSREENQNATEQIRDGGASLIYVTPERLENPEYLALLKESGVSLFVVDEAHCVSQWGHDFRPAYLSLAKACKALGRPPMLAVTATATPDVLEDIVKQLGMKRAVLVNTGIERKNLMLEVKATPSEEAKRKALLELLAQEDGSGILYVATIKLATELHGWLCAQGIDAGIYHGRLPMKQRKATQERFMAGETKVLVATNAFGLGVDKPDIRFVIHYTFPASLESYYQEAGRAGRDGRPARATLLYRLEDRRVQSYFLGGKYPSREDSQRVYAALLRGEREVEGVAKRKREVVLAQLESAGILRRGRAWRVLRTFSSNAALDAFLAEYEQRFQNDRERLDLMMRYAETGHCRGKMLSDYFEEDAPERCGHCDNCAREIVTKAA